MQKKIITTIVIFIISMFISLTSVNAATKLVFSENSNGNIKTSLHFEDGFVGGFDITLKYSGDVKYKQINLDSKVKNSHIEYNNNTHTINLKFTTGGVGTGHNLLNEKKELVLGNILFETSSKSNVSYTIECTALTIVGNDWNSKKIEPELENNKFTFKVSSTTEDKDDQKPGEDSKPDDSKDDDKNNNQSSGNNSSSNNNGSSGNSSNSGSSNNGSNNNNNSSANNSGNNGNNQNDNSSDDKTSTDDDKQDDDDNNDNGDYDYDYDTDDDTEDKDSSDEESTDSEDEDSLIPKIVEIVIGVALVGIAGTICFLAIKPKKVKDIKTDK